jgi:hypothetical protein
MMKIDGSLQARLVDEIERGFTSAAEVSEASRHHYFAHAGFACVAPKARPTSGEREAGVQIIVEAE